MIKGGLSREWHWEILQKQKRGRKMLKGGLIDSTLSSPGILTQFYTVDKLFVGFALCRSH